MKKTKPSLASLASRPDPFQDLDVLIDRLQQTTAESRLVEWKQSGLFGPQVTVRTKYRTVKVAISFANTDGGFILFGVSSDGRWIGLDSEDLTHFDPAKVTELINGVVWPELPVINFAQFTAAGKDYAVVHVPTSNLLPHVTTKPIVESSGKGKPRILIAKHAVYCRYGAKSDLATPIQHQKMVEKRTTFLRDELLRRVREVPIPVATAGSASTPGTGTVVTVARLTEDLSAPAVRVTRASGQASGVLLHEELSDGLFKEINNVLDANALLAGSSDRFVFGEEIYYRVYAERQHVEPTESHVDLLLRTALHDTYAPYLYWLTVASPTQSALELVDAINNPKHPLILGAIRAVVLLGVAPTEWLNEFLERKYRRFTQKPEFYWTFKKIFNRSGIADRRLLAMRTTQAANLKLPPDGDVRVAEILEKPEEAAALLSKVCVRVFQGEGYLRTPARQLDVAAYGTQVGRKAGEIWASVQSMSE